MKDIRAACATLLMLVSTGALAADKERHVYRPTGQWAMEYADDACRLVRNFSDGKTQLTVAFERFEIGPATRLGIAGGLALARANISTVGYRYLPEGVTRQSALLRTKLADGRDAFLIEAAALIPIAVGNRIMYHWRGTTSLAEFDKQEMIAAAKTSSVVITDGFSDEPELELGSMAKPVQALQACAYDLVKSWGVDPQAVASVSQFPQPLRTPDRWLDRGDYPAEVLRDHKAGSLQMRLIVSPAGEVESCHFDVGQPGPFEEATCRGIKARVKFRPALDANGMPMRTYWREFVQFRF